jgi:hypothetical protein
MEASLSRHPWPWTMTFEKKGDEAPDSRKTREHPVLMAGGREVSLRIIGPPWHQQGEQ